MNLNTINKILTLARRRIFKLSIQDQLQSALLVEQIEVDESYFGARHARGKRGHGALGKIKVFGLLKRGDKLYTEIVPDCSANTLSGIIRGKASIDSIIHSDDWKADDGLVDFGCKNISECTMERMNLPEVIHTLMVLNLFGVYAKLD